MVLSEVNMLGLKGTWFSLEFNSAQIPLYALSAHTEFDASKSFSRLFCSGLNRKTVA